MTSPARGFSAVLWDMDGTLVDTEPYWMTAEIELMGRYGLHWDETLGELMVGNTLLRSAEILREHGLPLPAEQIVEILLDGVVAQVREHVPFRPGALELLADLRAAQIPCALVTMSYRRLAEAVVAACAPGTFTALITGDEVSRGKPHPEPYLVGADVVGFAPQECVALEDSLPGLQSAVAAGTLTVGIPHIVPLPDTDGAVLVESLAGMTAEALGHLVSGSLSAPRPR